MELTLNDKKAAYSVGPLLYMPALRTDIAQKLSTGMKGLRSAALCLEDTIRDDLVEEAQNNLVLELKKLNTDIKSGKAPNRTQNVFIRVRTPEQICRLITMLGDDIGCVSGFIIPKIDDITLAQYIPEIKKMHSCTDKKLYIMPIIENPSLLQLSSRYAKLQNIYDMLMDIRQDILNVRIGGNDFCRALKLSADIHTTIYDILPAASLLSDISAQFTADFVVSAPVWNYFAGGSDNLWESGMREEIKRDKAAGFIGKTIIHPSQIEVFNREMIIPQSDYEDAKKIIDSIDSEIQVVKSINGDRMYEHKIHLDWAEKTLCLAQIYGIKNEYRSLPLQSTCICKENMI